jgi:hypothetical protein
VDSLLVGSYVSLCAWMALSLGLKLNRMGDADPVGDLAKPLHAISDAASAAVSATMGSTLGTRIVTSFGTMTMRTNAGIRARFGANCTIGKGPGAQRARPTPTGRAAAYGTSSSRGMRSVLQSTVRLGTL